MRSFDRLGIATALALFLATFTVTPLTRDSSFLGPSWLLIVLIAVLGLALRRARLGAGAVLSAQLLVLIGFVLALAITMPGEGEPIFDHLGTLLVSGAEHMQQQAAPMLPNDGVKLMFVATVGLMMVLTDLVAIGIGRPVWALGPPATLFLVPAVGLRSDTGVMSFACIAIGYLGILIADGLNSTARWTRGLSRDSAEGFGTATPVVWRAAGLVGVPSLVLALLFGAALPTLALPGFGVGNGPGSGGPLQLTDPTLDLRRNLNLPADVKVIEYRTDRTEGVYLRLAALPKLSNGGWSNVTTRLNQGTDIGLIPGVQDSPEQLRNTQISVFDFGSEYLPLPYAPRTVDVDGGWAYDPNSLIVLSTERYGRTDATRNLSYSVASLDTEPTSAQLANAAAGTPADVDVTREIPADLPASLRRLTEEVIKDHQTPALKAAAIQSFLRGTRFTYSTQTLPGSGYTALENFLLRDRKGYCEQFAGAMAMMARIAGIPSRVAVGFLPGEKRADGTWEVSVHKMHAWPELYFAGYGWVRFEPTPGSVTGTAPIWTQQQTQQPGDDPSLEPSASATAAEETTGADATDQPVDQQDPGSALDTGSLLRRSLLVGGAMLGLLILAAPATIRIRRRGVRLSADAAPEERVEAAWAEIRDTVVDYGGAWPEGSPRTIGREIAERLDPAESAAMTSVATLVERGRYSRGLGGDDSTRSVAALTREVRRGLGAPQSPRRRIRAVLLPRSLFRRSKV